MMMGVVVSALFVLVYTYMFEILLYPTRSSVVN